MPNEPISDGQSLRDFAPKLLELTSDLLFADIWERPTLSKRDRSLITVSALVALYRTDQIPPHMKIALDNGLTVEELTELITHLAFYASWPNAMTAIRILQETVQQHNREQDTAS